MISEISSYYSRKELEQIGFLELGQDVNISRKASIYGAEKMQIGNHVRIDDFVYMSGKINIGNHVHIAPFSALYGGEAGIYLCDYSGISSRVAIYAHSDDYSGKSMMNPTIPAKYINPMIGAVTLEKHVTIGTGSTVFPGVTIREGSVVGSMSLVSSSLKPWGVYFGIPCRRLYDRSKQVLEMEKELIKDEELYSTET